jgi:putative DNA primase/helicase
VQLLATLAHNMSLFRSTDGRFYAQVPVGERQENYGLKSQGFRDWIIDGYLIDQAEPPSPWAIRRVVGMLEARARFNDAIPEIYIRVARNGDGEDGPYFLDLGAPSGRAIEIHPQGWFAVDRPAVHFRRPSGQLPLPMPSHDGAIDLLRPYVNLDDNDFRLMITWIAPVPNPPHDPTRPG